MSSFTRQLRDELIGALRVDLGTYDLSDYSGTHRVDVAQGGQLPVSPPYLLIATRRIRSTYEADMGEYLVRGEFLLWGFTESLALDTSEREGAALDFAGEVISRIEQVHDTAGLGYPLIYSCTECLCVLDDVFAAEPEVPPGVAQFAATVAWAAVRTRGI